MVHYSQLLSELTAMDNTLQENMEYLKRGKTSDQSQKVRNEPISVVKQVPGPAVEEALTPLTRPSDREAMAQHPLLFPQPLFDLSFDLKQPAPFPKAPSSAASSSLSSSSAASSPSSSCPPFLHRACQLFPKSKDVIEISLTTEPTAAGTSMQIEAASANSKGVPKPNKNSHVRERYTYPINIALFHKASPAVVELLANAAPDVLLTPDGRDGHTTLGIVLQRPRGNSEGDDSLRLRLVDAVLQANPASAHSAVDRRQNYPLHVACSKGAALEVIRRLHRAYPSAIAQRNLAGETPLMIAQRYCACREDVLDYLQSQTWR